MQSTINTVISRKSVEKSSTWFGRNLLALYPNPQKLAIEPPSIVMRSWLRNHFFTRIKEREETERLAFSENGSKLFEKLIVSCNGKPIPIRSFSTQELCQATHNYHDYTYLGMHRYKGSLEGRIVLIKLFPDSKSLVDFAINDLVISAQMCAHNNVLKPIGCCLENQPPILVY